MSLSVRAQRLAYRVAFRLLQVRWALTHPEQRGVKCLITDGDRVLLVRHTYGPRVWDLPGGRGHRNEAPLQTARREMEEELGLGDAPWRAHGELRGRSYGRHDHIDVIAAEVASPQLRVDPVELETAQWFARDALPSPLSRFVGPVLDGAPRDSEPISGRPAR